MQCIFHRCKEACNVLKSGWSITSIIHHWFRTKYCNATEVFLLWDASPVNSLGPHGLGLATRPHMSRAGSRLRRLESCTVSRPCPCEILNTGLLVKYPGPSWALSLVTHRQAQDAIQYSGEITGARRHHDAVLVCFSKPQHWVPATRQSTIMGAHTFADGLWINTKCRHPHRSF